MLRSAALADVPIAVVGAGVVGLAVASRLAREAPGLVVLERRDRHGTETSSRNSEVIHAGMYYPTGSLKARLCLEGNRRLYALCAEHDIPHRRITKIITATEESERPALETLLARAQANRVDLRPLSGAEARALEPNVRSVAALYSPNTGIVSAHGLMDFFLHDARSRGATLLPRTEVVEVERRDHDYRLTIREGGTTDTFTAERVVNAAGLGADRVAARAGIDVDAAGYRLRYCKGSYFSLAPRRWGLCSRLVYPVPGQVSLGVHAVLGLDGRVRFGPDAEYQEDPRDVSVAAGKRNVFAESVRRLFPDVKDEDLEPDTAGVRPKLQGPGDPVRDFVVAEESARGLPGFVNLIGIESPGLTAAPALADEVARLLGS